MPNYYNKDLYKILNLTYEASKDEIKTAYKKLAKMYHPDVAGSNGDIDKFKEIKEAYDILSDDESRKKYDVLRGFYRQKLEKETNQKNIKNKYDEYLKQAKKNAEKQDSFSDSINDALDSLFHTKNGRKNQSGDTKKTINGTDINLDINISCFEAITGTNRKINILHTQPCPNCEGRIFINGAKCNMCGGSGVISLQKKINVKIPKDVKHGSKIRVKNEGNRGLNGGKDGDLYLIVNIEKNPYFETEGMNILCNLPITPFEAVLGAEITIPYIDGNINIKVPPMTSSGQKLRLAGMGLYNKSKTKKGDMIITVFIKLPSKLSKKELELYEELKSHSNEDIRVDMKNAKQSTN